VATSVYCYNSNMSRANEFLTVFAKLEKEILLRAGKVPQLQNFMAHEQSKKTRTFAGSLDILQEYGKDRIVNEYLEKLRLYGQLRNALAHNYDDEPIAEPREDTVEGIKRLYDSVTTPQAVWQIMTEKPVVFSVKDDAYESLGIMDKNWYTSVPVYSDDRLVGVLSERSMLRWAVASANDDVKLAELRTLDDIAKYFDSPDATGTDLYYFVPKNLDVYSVRDLFEDGIRDGKRVAAVFVTHNGKASEALLGIVTAWDLHRIDNL